MAHLTREDLQFELTKALAELRENVKNDLRSCLQASQKNRCGPEDIFPIAEDETPSPNSYGSGIPADASFAASSWAFNSVKSLKKGSRKVNDGGHYASLPNGRDSPAVQRMSPRMSPRHVAGNSRELRMSPRVSGHGGPGHPDPASPMLHVSDAAGDAARVNWPDAQMLRIDRIIAVFILLNSVMLGMETDWDASRPGEHLPFFCVAGEAIFCIVFLVELIIRMCVLGRGFWTHPTERFWNIFDFVLVVLQVPFQLSEMFLYHVANSPQRDSGSSASIASDAVGGQRKAAGDVLNYLRMLRFVRVLRLARFARILRVFQEPREMMTSVMNSMRSLGWTLVLTFIFIYSVSIVLVQLAFVQTIGERSEDMQLWYGTFPRTLLTMFECIAGGVSWDEAIRPLADISPFLGILFCLYISFCVFALMNVVTGVFVQRATKAARHEEDSHTAKLIRDVFMHEADEEIDSSMFQSKMDSADMKEYFQEMGIDVSEGSSLFALLDADDSGSVTAYEIVQGCLRLRGEATALDLSLLMRETVEMHRNVAREHGEIRDLLQRVCDRFGVEVEHRQNLREARESVSNVRMPKIRRTLRKD